jgi:hypothetical protein
MKACGATLEHHAKSLNIVTKMWCAAQTEYSCLTVETKAQGATFDLPAK